MANSATERGGGILLNTLSGLNRNKPLIAKLALIFLDINTLSLTGLYREVKYFLPIIFTPPYSNQST